MGKENISFEMDAFNRNKILKDHNAIAEKIYYIFNSQPSEYSNMGELPQLLDNFRQEYRDKSEIENKLQIALNEFLDKDIVISAVVYQEEGGILAVFIQNLDDPIAFKLDDGGLSRLRS